MRSAPFGYKRPGPIANISSAKYDNGSRNIADYPIKNRLSILKLTNEDRKVYMGLNSEFVSNHRTLRCGMEVITDKERHF